MLTHWQHQECQRYSYFWGRLHTVTSANHLHDNMYTHISTSLILLFPHSYQLCSVSLQLHFPPHLDDFISGLKWVEYIEYFIIFSSCMYNVMFAYMLSLSFFWYLFIGLIFISYMSCFPVLVLYVLMKFILHYTHEMHQHQWFIIVVYFVHVFHCTNLMFFASDFSSISTYLKNSCILWNSTLVVFED